MASEPRVPGTGRGLGSGSTSGVAVGGVVALIGIVLVSLNLRTAVTSISPLFGRIDADVALGAAGMSVLGMLPTLMFGVAGFVAARGIRRFGLERVAIAAMSLVAIGSLARAVAPDAITLAAGSVIALAGAGTGNIVAPPLIKRYFPERLSAVGVVYTVGLQLGTVVPALATVPLADAVGWRASLGSWALLGAMAAVPWVAEFARSGRSRATSSPSGTEGDGTAGDGTTASVRPWTVPLGIAMAVFFGTNSLLTYAFFTWLPRIVGDVMGMGETAGGIALGMFSAVGLVTAVLMPLAAGKFSNPYPLVVLAVVLYLVAFAGIRWAPTAAPWLWVFLLGLGPMTFPLLLALINLRTRTHAGSAALSGFTQGVGYLVASLGAPVFGWLWEVGGSLDLPLLFLLASLAVMAVSAWEACKPRMLEDEIAERHGG